MKIELLSYRLLRCRFFSLLCWRLVLSLLLLLDDDDDNPFRAYRVSPPVIVLKSAFIVFSLAHPSPRRTTSQQSIELKEFSSFLFYFNANSKKTSSDVPGTKHERNFHSILSSSETHNPARPVPHTRRFYWEGFYFFNNNGRDDRHVDRGTTRRPS